MPSLDFGSASDKRSTLGIHIHNLTCPNTGKCAKGTNPFDSITFKRGEQVFIPKVYDPKAHDAYGDIKDNLSAWVEAAIAQ